MSAPDGVEVVRRRGDGRSWLFAINHTDEPVEVDVAGHDLVTDRPVDRLQLDAGRVAVVREG